MCKTFEFDVTEKNKDGPKNDVPAAHEGHRSQWVNLQLLAASLAHFNLSAP